MHLHLRKLALAVAASLVSLSASAAVSISTGVAPWLVNGNPVVIESPYPVGIYVPPVGDASWVGTDANDADLNNSAGWPAVGTYTFTLALGAYAPATDSIFSLQYASDNAVTWTISGGSFASGQTSCTATDCFSQFGSPPPGAPYSLVGYFSAGSVLTATVVNGPLTPGGNEPNPMGLMVSGVTAVPEPAEWALMLSGLAFVGLIARRRRG